MVDSKAYLIGFFIEIEWAKEVSSLVHKKNKKAKKTIFSNKLETTSSNPSAEESKVILFWLQPFSIFDIPQG